MASDADEALVADLTATPGPDTKYVIIQSCKDGTRMRLTWLKKDTVESLTAAVEKTGYEIIGYAPSASIAETYLQLCCRVQW